MLICSSKYKMNTNGYTIKFVHLFTPKIYFTTQLFKWAVCFNDPMITISWRDVTQCLVCRFVALNSWSSCHGRICPSDNDTATPNIIENIQSQLVWNISFNSTCVILSYPCLVLSLGSKKQLCDQSEIDTDWSRKAWYANLLWQWKYMQGRVFILIPLWNGDRMLIRSAKLEIKQHLVRSAIKIIRSQLDTHDSFRRTWTNII